MGKDRAHKGRRKWGGILGGAKHKHSSRHDEDVVDGVRGLHDTLPKHPLSTTISKEAMVSTNITGGLIVHCLQLMRYCSQCTLLERKLEDSQLIFEFEKIPRIKGNADFTTASLPENINRNR